MYNTKEPKLLYKKEKMQFLLAYIGWNIQKSSFNTILADKKKKKKVNIREEMKLKCRNEKIEDKII